MVDVWAVAGGKRGVGKTTTTWGLAHALGSAGENVLVVDWDRSAPDLADQFGVSDPEHTIRSVLEGHIRIREAAYEVDSGIAVVAGEAIQSPSETKNGGGVADLTDEFDRFDVVLIDTGRPFVPSTQTALDAADGVLAVSTPDRAARRNTAVFHEYLANHGYSLLGTVLTRADDDPSLDERWDCALLARLPDWSECPNLKSGGESVPSEYQRLANEITGRVGEGTRTVERGSGPVSRSNEGFLPPSIEPEGCSERANVEQSVPAESSEPGSGGETPDGEDEGQSSAPGENDDRVRVSRRVVLTLVAGVLGTVSAGVLGSDDKDGSSEKASVRDTETEVVGFGYGGTPITATTSTSTATATEVGTAVQTTVATLTGSDEPRSTETPTNTATTVTETKTLSNGGPSGGATATPVETATATPVETATATPVETATPTPVNDDLDDYGELGYGEGGYGGTL